MSAIEDTTILQAVVEQLSVDTAQTARFRGTPAACAQLTV